MRPFGRCFLPGPTDVHPDIWQAMQEPMYFTFSPHMQEVNREIQPFLQQLFGTTEPVMISTSAATGLMEASIRNGVRETVLVVVGGYFGEMYARVAEGCGKEVIRINVPPGATLEPEQLGRFLDGPKVDAVALVHSESSTGALAPLPDLVKVIRRETDALVLVDGVTSVGTLPFEAQGWDLDFVFTGSQKALGLAPGLAVATASPRFMARAEQIRDCGWYLSVAHLVGAARKNLPLTTPALPVYHSLLAQVRRIAASGGLEARFARHDQMAARMEEWAAQRQDVSLMARAGRRSRAVSAFTLPPEKGAGDVVAELERRGWLVATGMPPLGEQVIRIGHMGDLELDHLNPLLIQLEEVLA